MIVYCHFCFSWVLPAPNRSAMSAQVAKSIKSWADKRALDQRGSSIFLRRWKCCYIFPESNGNLFLYFGLSFCAGRWQDHSISRKIWPIKLVCDCEILAGSYWKTMPRKVGWRFYLWKLWLLTKSQYTIAGSWRLFTTFASLVVDGKVLMAGCLSRHQPPPHLSGPSSCSLHSFHCQMSFLTPTPSFIRPGTGTAWAFALLV